MDDGKVTPTPAPSAPSRVAAPFGVITAGRPSSTTDRVEIGGEVFTLPKGASAELVLAIRNTPKAASGALAILQHAGLADALAFAAGPTESFVEIALPAFAHDGCVQKPELAQIRNNWAVFSVRSKCPPADVTGQEKAFYSVALLRLADEPGMPTVVLSGTFQPLAPTEQLTVDFAPDDRDKDGRDDIFLRVLYAAEGDKGEPLSLPLEFFDRPAGLSRNVTEPASALKTIAQRLLSDSQKKENNTGAQANIHSSTLRMRRLVGLVCSDGGNEHSPFSSGPVSCNAAEALLDAGLADVTSAFAGSTQQALVAATDLKAALPPGDRRHAELDRLLNKHVPFASAKVVHSSEVEPFNPPSLAWQPLAFNESSDLLVRTHQSVVRIAHDTFEETVTDLTPWPLAPSAPGLPAATERILTGIRVECDLPFAVAHFEPGGLESKPLDVATPIIAMRYDPLGKCKPRPLPVTAVETRSNSLVVSVSSEFVEFRSEPNAIVAALTKARKDGSPRPGGPYSPDGKSIVTVASGFIAVTTAGKARRIDTRETPQLREASGCVVANGAKRFACIVRKGVVVGELN